jgi:hypothetical protein
VSARPAIGVFLAAMLASPALAQQNIPVPQKRPSAGVIMPPEKPAKPPEAAPTKEVAPAQHDPAPAAEEKTEERETKMPPNAEAERQRWAACPAVLTGAVTGEVEADMTAGDCGVQSPLHVTAIGPVKLGTKATMTCGMATALAALMPDATKAASDILGSPLVALETGSGYECRNRNGDASGKLSQHAFANALDIAVFKLADGRSVAVGADWPHLAQTAGEGARPEPPQQRATTPQARFLVAVHQAACGLFTTVLGPDANAAHHDHFHLDLGCHGKDCKYMICE